MDLIAMRAGSDVLISQRISLVAVAANTNGGILADVGPFNRIVEKADRKIVRPTFSQRTGLYFRQTSHARFGSDEPITDSVPIFVDNDLSVVVRIHIVDKRRGASRKKAHTDFRGSSFGCRRERCIVRHSALLCFGQNWIVADTTVAHVVGLKVSGSLVETQLVIVVMGH